MLRHSAVALTCSSPGEEKWKWLPGPAGWAGQLDGAGPLLLGILLERFAAARDHTHYLHYFKRDLLPLPDKQKEGTETPIFRGLLMASSVRGFSKEDGKGREESCRWSSPPESAWVLQTRRLEPETHANVISRAALDWNGRI